MKFWKKKYLPAEEAITRGDSSRMEITHNIVAEGDMKQMKIRTGHNSMEKMYYIQITERETMTSYRIYLTEQEYRDLAFHMNRTYHFTLAETASSQDNPDSNPATHHSQK